MEAMNRTSGQTQVKMSFMGQYFFKNIPEGSPFSRAISSQSSAEANIFTT
jgi:hypothetical protein